MPDVTVKYKGVALVEMSSESTKTLLTKGKYCEDDIEVNYVPPVDTDSNDVIGNLGESNDVLLEGNLADGTYTFKYKKKDGTYDTIGTYTLDNKVYYSATSELTNCTNSNGATTIVGGTIYSATIIADDGYDLKSVTVTMGGADITSSAVSGGNINIANVTGNIYITAVATEKPVYTNLAKPNATNKTDFTIWCNESRMGSDASYRQNTATITTNYMPITSGDTIYIKGLVIDATSTNMSVGSFGFWFQDPSGTTGSTNKAGVVHFSNAVAQGWFTISGSAESGYTLDFIKSGDTKFFRISAALTGTVDDVIITRNEPIS